MLILGFLTCIGLLLGRLWLLRRHSHEQRQVDAWWRPPELRGAPVAFSERTFRALRPFPLVARVDRGFQVAGEIVLVELKTRRRHMVYHSDVIELSAQKLAIEGQGAELVSAEAFVLTEDRKTGSRKSHRIALYGPAEMVDLTSRRHGILTGRLEPAAPKHALLCKRCAFKAACRDRFRW